MLKIATCIISTILVAVCAHHPLSNNHINGRADLSLANFLLEHQGRAASPASMQCFQIYLPVMQQTSSQWAVSYEKCLKVAENDRSAVLEQASASQKAISIQAGEVCNYVENCNSINNSMSALDCFGLLSLNTASDVYALSNNATDTAGALREQITTIDNNSNKCCNATERTYVENTARIYDAMDYCLQNGPPQTVPPPTAPTAPTTTTSTATTTTAAPYAPRSVQIAAAPRRTPVASILTKESNEEEENNNYISAFNYWLQQNGSKKINK